MFQLIGNGYQFEFEYTFLSIISIYKLALKIIFLIHRGDGESAFDDFFYLANNSSGYSCCKSLFPFSTPWAIDTQVN